MALRTPSTQEYFEVHRNTLDAIVQGISKLVTESADTVVEQDGSGHNPYLSYPYTNEAVADLYAGRLSDDEIAEIVNVKNDAAIAAAHIDFIDLRTLATIRAVAKNPGLCEGKSADDVMLDYEKAYHRVAFRAGRFVFSSTELVGVETLGSVGAFNLKKYDELTTAKLSIISLGKDIDAVDYSFEPTDDEQLRRWITVLGVEFFSLIGIAVGIFKDEAELDRTLSELRVSFIGTSKEDEVGPILDEVRVRAVAAKDSNAFNTEFSLDLVSDSQLAEAVSDIAEAQM